MRANTSPYAPQKGPDVVPKISKKLSGAAALAAGVTAVVLVGAGGAVAAALVTSADIKDQTIKAVDIGSGGVTSSEVRDATLGGWDLRVDTVDEDRLSAAVRDKLNAPAEPGPQGETGPAGPQGETGPQGDPGVSGYEVVETTASLPGDDAVHSFTASCPEGKQAIGGGFGAATEANAATTRLVGSSPVVEPVPDDPNGAVTVTGWQVQLINDSTPKVAYDVNAWAVCALTS